jgi:hypothetical protein
VRLEIHHKCLKVKAELLESIKQLQADVRDVSRVGPGKNFQDVSTALSSKVIGDFIEDTIDLMKEFKGNTELLNVKATYERLTLVNVGFFISNKFQFIYKRKNSEQNPYSL